MLLHTSSHNTSHTHTQAETFKRELFPSIKRTYGSYAELAADPDVDIVYIGTVHNFHCEHSLMMIASGKHVLCEKPVAMNAQQAVKMVEAARAKKVFFLEGERDSSLRFL